MANRRKVTKIRKVYEVKLISGPLTLTIDGVKFVRNVKQTISKPSIIYKALLSTEFSCKEVSTGRKSAPKRQAAPPPPPSPEEEDEDEEEDEEDEEDEDEPEEASPELTRAQLKQLSKKALISHAEENKIDVESSASKAEIIDAILEAAEED